MKVSKVVLIVVALHVLVIGGIFIFEGCSRSKTSGPEMASNESTPGQAAESMAPGAPGEPATMPNPLGPAPAGGLTPATPPPASEAAAPAPATRTHVVKKGDSLWKIAKAEGISVGELSRANNLTKTSALKIGQKLTIPAAKTQTPTVAAASVAPVATDAAAVAAPASDVIGADYTVKSGDSLWKLARQQHVTVAALKQANNLTSDSLKVGQKLRIPTATAAASTAAPAGGPAAGSSTAWREPGTYNENGQTIHIVDFNESPALIAKKYGIKTEDLLKANNISDAKKVQYGQRLVIPLISASPAASAQSAPVAGSAPAGTTPASAPTAPVVAASQTMAQQ
jgi:LysM repeat protein